MNLAADGTKSCDGVTDLAARRRSNIRLRTTRVMVLKALPTDQKEVRRAAVAVN